MSKVKKRDGSLVDFDGSKIINALAKAYTETGKAMDTAKWELFVEQNFPDDDDTVYLIEDIQDEVQKKLIEVDYEVGLAFVLYRNKRKTDRELANEQFDFVKTYIKASNTANATVDDNSNVGNKNVGVLNAEIHKRRNINSNREWERRKLRELFPDSGLDKQYVTDLLSRVFYKNDENSFPFPVPYTYSSKEVVTVKYKGKKLCCALDTLYSLVDETESLFNEEDNAYAKFPTDLYVKDRDGWTAVERMIRKERRRDLVRVKTAFGEDVVVTDNHPMIVNDNIEDTIPAINSLGQKQLRVSQHIDFGGKEEIDLASVLDYAECYEHFLLFQPKEKSQYNGISRHLKLDRDFGYVVGFFIGDGHYNNNNINFTQKERATLEQLADKLWKSCGIVTTISYKKDKSNCWSAKVHSEALVSLFKNVFKIKDYAQNKNLPIDIFEYNKDFALGILEGIVDSDGTVETNSQVSIRLASRECICQLAVLVKEFGFGASMFTQNTPFSNNSGMIHQNYTIWGVRFSNTPNCVKLTNSYKWRNNVTKEVASGLKYKDGWCSITNVDKVENGSFLLQNKFIYDITTKTHSFVANNLFVHNCVAASMYPFLLHGLELLGGKSTKPKNLDSFCGMYINLVFALSGMFAGACMYKDQKLFIRCNGEIMQVTAKELVEKMLTPSAKSFVNYQGEWAYNETEQLEVFENGVFVPVNRVFKRRYKDSIYKISTKDGFTALVSKDHIFKQMFKGREFETKAEQLKVGDTVYMHKDFSPIVDSNSKDWKTGWLMGIICGDGSISGDYEVRIAVNYQQEYLGDIFNEYAQEIFGVQLNKRKGNRCLDFRLSNKEFNSKVKEFIIGSSTYDKHIDTKDKSIEFCLGFLDGLFCADGSYSEKRGISISLTNKDLSDNIFDIVSMLGISYAGVHTLPAKDNRKESYYQYVPARIIKYLVHTQKKMLLRGESKQDSHREFYYYGHNALTKAGNPRCLWSYNGTQHYETDVIDSISIIENDDDFVYEIETSTHWYNCGGFITHNCALPETLLCFDWYARKEWGDDYYLNADKTITANWVKRQLTVKQQIHQYFEQIVHSINQPSGARGQQSAFVNFSIFDKPFFDGMFGNFYFPDETQPKWESVQWLQECFMEWFNAERLRTILTFPVVSVTMLVDKETGAPVDTRMEEFACKQWAEGDSFFVYLSDSVDSLSSCCFKGNELITINKNGEEQTLTIEAFVNEYTNDVNQQGVFIKTDAQIISYNKETQEPELANIDGVLKKEYSGKMFTFEVGDKSITVTADHLMLVQDVNTNEILEVCADKVFENKEQYLIAVASKDVCFDKLTNCKEGVVSNELVYDIQLDKNHYFSANGLITHNCRLKNKIQTKEFNFTNGNIGVETGSKSVISMNLSRIMQNFFREVIGDKEAVVKDRIAIIRERWSDYQQYIGAILERIYKYHIAYNENLFDIYNAKLLPAYEAGFIDLNKQYLTIGLNGLNQSAEFLGMSCSDNDDYKWYCENLFSTIKEMNSAHNGKFNGHKLTFNTEQVPAESLAVKNYNWDKEDGYWVPTDTNLYASYVYKPNDVNVQILEKIRMHGDRFIGDYLDGGSAAHLNLDAHLSKVQYRYLLRYAIANGCSYMTFNVPNSECQECGYITKHPIKECPKCGSKKIDYYDRVIGYLTKVANWSEGRQIEQGLRIYEGVSKEDIGK